VVGLGLAAAFLAEPLRDDRPLVASGASTVAVVAARRPVAAAAREARARASVSAARSCPSGSSSIRACFGRDELDDTNDLSTNGLMGTADAPHTSRTTFCHGEHFPRAASLTYLSTVTRGTVWLLPRLARVRL
jgi:hypothetical protein